jgi:hypothetical protein
MVNPIVMRATLLNKERGFLFLGILLNKSALGS